ncbi:SPOR domain-containing protein [Mucilaginibacter sp.]
MKKRVSVWRSVFTVFVKCVVLIGLLSLPSLVLAQTRGKVEVDKDSKVDSLIGNYLVGGGKTNTGEPASESSYGYRIQIFSGSDRKAAYNVQSKFQNKFPDTHTYLSYRDPNFKVKVGDFRSRIEAEKMVEEMKPAFGSLFIISEKINLPKLDTE